MSLGNLPGLGALREALDTTNSLLEQVLQELQHTNGHALAQITEELRVQRGLLDQALRSDG